MYVPKHQPDFISAHKITRSLLNEGYLIIHSAKAIINPQQAFACRSSFLYGHTPINHMAIWEEIQRQLQSNSTYKVTISLRNTATNTPFYIEEQGFSDPKNPTILRGFWRMLSPSSVPALRNTANRRRQHGREGLIQNAKGLLYFVFGNDQRA